MKPNEKTKRAKNALSEKVVCRTPTPGKKPTRIDVWKFEAVRNAILDAVPVSGVGVKFQDLPGMVAQLLGKKQCEKLGSVMWYTTAVKLELEVRGEIHRVANVSPQKLLRGGGKK